MLSVLFKLNIKNNRFKLGYINPALSILWMSFRLSYDATWVGTYANKYWFYIHYFEIYFCIN